MKLKYINWKRLALILCAAIVLSMVIVWAASATYSNSDDQIATSSEIAKCIVTGKTTYDSHYYLRLSSMRKVEVSYNKYQLVQKGDMVTCKLSYNSKGNIIDIEIWE